MAAVKPTVCHWQPHFLKNILKYFKNRALLRGLWLDHALA
jgi:hypothetical protein